ncbi:hypothetical protein XA68_14728 [Ophiocordyceps unilateralis]|uniref:Uncharacterized protein n=1 Tax=Ophiocordyceps unilateralis TaxID=268505 RepID=A0A2A9PMR4_OPHUN|nr:hypothetical protein XA68_14728 [Ophiocordyceps unilateralis]
MSRRFDEAEQGPRAKGSAVRTGESQSTMSQDEKWRNPDHTAHRPLIWQPTAEAAGRLITCTASQLSLSLTSPIMDSFRLSLSYQRDIWSVTASVTLLDGVS